MLDWILQKANITRELIAEKRFQRTGARNKNSVDKTKIVFTEPAPKRTLDQHMGKQQDQLCGRNHHLAWILFAWQMDRIQVRPRSPRDSLYTAAGIQERLGTRNPVGWERTRYILAPCDVQHSQQTRPHATEPDHHGRKLTEQRRPDLLGFHTGWVPVQGQEYRLRQEMVQCKVVRRQKHRTREPQGKSRTAKSTAFRPNDPEPMIPNRWSHTRISKTSRLLTIGTSNSEPWQS